ncbi:hypothetical protein [Paracoccus zhouxuedongae]|uniref:hypothetical protein n=1 Tax=Paracoccus sp. p3-h83 TaxID=3342805 RepID=UPI0035BC6D10
MARDQLDLTRLALVMAEANKGNVGAMRELSRMIEANDRRVMAATYGDVPDAAPQKPARIGKKEAAQAAAESVGGEGSDWGADILPGFGRPN